MNVALRLFTLHKFRDNTFSSCRNCLIVSPSVGPFNDIFFIVTPLSRNRIQELDPQYFTGWPKKLSEAPC